MKSIIVTLAILGAGPALAEDSMTYHRFGHDTYGSDGSRTHEFGGDTYHDDGHGHRTKCHEFAGNLTCTGE